MTSIHCSPGCYKITTVFSHAQTVVVCMSCSTVLCQPTGGRARLTEGRCAVACLLSYSHPFSLQVARSDENRTDCCNLSYVCINTIADTFFIHVLKCELPFNHGVVVLELYKGRSCKNTSYFDVTFIIAN